MKNNLKKDLENIFFPSEFYCMKRKESEKVEIIYGPTQG